MSSYFDRIQQQLCDAVQRRPYRRWYLRLFRVGRAHPLVVVLAALVVATPAVAAATNWFGIGAPDKIPLQSPTIDAGRPLPGTSQLLSLRVPDPQGGPPWGLRLVHTTRDDTCIQLGRVEDSKLGSLGIDDAWNNDHLFHAFPTASEGDDCGTTDAAGDGFVNVAYTGDSANANPTASAHGPQGTRCRSPQIPLRPLSKLPPRARKAILASEKRQSKIPLCPQNSTRIVFMGLLGPDATSITYQAPNGSLKTEKTTGTDGAYLLVFPENARTCNLYTHNQFGSYGPCGNTESVGGASPNDIGAIKAVNYRDRQVCRLTPNLTVLNAYRAFARALEKKLDINPQTKQLTTKIRQELKAANRSYFKSHHLNARSLQQATQPTCPAVGYVAAKQKRVTAAMVTAPITVKIVPHTQSGPRVDISFTARQPVTTSSSWYEDAITNPPGCNGSGSSGVIDLGNVRAGQRLHDNQFLNVPPCQGTYHGIIGYMQNSGLINQDTAGGGTPGRDGSVIVGRFSFTIR